MQTLSHQLTLEGEFGASFGHNQQVISRAPKKMLPIKFHTNWKCFIFQSVMRFFALSPSNRLARAICCCFLHIYGINWRVINLHCLLKIIGFFLFPFHSKEKVLPLRFVLCTAKSLRVRRIYANVRLKWQELNNNYWPSDS